MLGFLLFCQSKVTVWLTSGQRRRREMPSKDEEGENASDIWTFRPVSRVYRWQTNFLHSFFFHHHSFSTGFWGINKDDNLIWNLHIFQTIKLLNLIFNKDVPQEYFVPFPGKFSWELFFIIREDLFIVWWHFLWLPLI